MGGDEGGRLAMSRKAALFAVVAAVVAAALLSPPGLLAAAATTVAAVDHPEVVVAPPPDGCTRRCGDISIPYPFGVEPGCYLEPGFNLTCDDRSRRRPHRLFLGDGTVQVLEISIANGTVRINGSYVDFSHSPAGTPTTGVVAAANGTWSGALGEGGPYTLAPWRNRLIAIGCDVRAVLLGDHNQTVSTCSTFCNHLFTGAMLASTDCSGADCCQAKILLERSSYGFQAFQTNGEPSFNFTTRLYVVEDELSTDPGLLINNDMSTLPAVLNWRINHTTCHGNGSSPACRSSHSFCKNRTLTRLDTFREQGHVCHCADGYQGNPYVADGCLDINECRFPDLYPCYGVCINIIGGYRCQCPPGFRGNASVPNGCQDIDECAHPDIYRCNGICTNKIGTFHCQCNKGTYWDPFGNRGCIAIKTSSSDLKIGLLVGSGTSFLLLAIATPLVTRKIKRHKVKKLKERFFKQNHGLLLQQLISQRSDIGGRMIITLRELEQATNNFDASHKIGGGGHGVVYKGLLDLQVVAIKKSKIVVQREIDDFINEVAILSQINHRNIVKLLGCCLETEVPLLVYEFISNGTLAQHLHVEGPVSISWDDRLRIALEISKAVAYLHSAASTPILHRDIKSSNILLDDNLTAKVSDFGASKYISIDQTGVTTAIQGTIGYLDPMYYYTGRLTEKSDVFSFGVLLIELLTRKKPFAYQSDDGDGLVSHFASLLTKGNLVDMIDPQILEEESEQVHEVATLAAKCTKLNGEDRLTSREVEMTLENLRVIAKKHHRDTTSRRNDRDQTAARCMSIIEGLAVETSR